MTKSLVPGAAIALILAACATTPATPNKTTVAANAKPPAGCVAQTATRIPVKNDACAGFGATYSKDDLDRTGEIYLDRALSTLDPSITRH